MFFFVKLFLVLLQHLFAMILQTFLSNSLIFGGDLLKQSSVKSSPCPHRYAKRIERHSLGISEYQGFVVYCSIDLQEEYRDNHSGF